MPTYTYQCNICAHQFDQRQKFSDSPLENCPKCDGRLRRLVNNVGGVVFKGSGFYITDSRNGSKGKTAATTTSETPASDSKADNKSSASNGQKPEPKAKKKSEPT